MSPDQQIGLHVLSKISTLTEFYTRTRQYACVALVEIGPICQAPDVQCVCAHSIHLYMALCGFKGCLLPVLVNNAFLLRVSYIIICYIIYSRIVAYIFIAKARNL